MGQEDTTREVKARVTLMSNFYNEEYLLPFWCEYHKSMFDDAILINYGSTDKSVEIINRICPDWKIVNTRNKDFDAHEIDREIMDIESDVSGYKFFLNTTEFFLVGPDYRNYLKPLDNEYLEFPSLTALSKRKCHYPASVKDLLGDIEFLHDKIRSPRYMLSHKNGNYTPGRHTKRFDLTNLLPGYVIWMGYYPWNDRLLLRKLQIKNKMSERDKKEGFGHQHLMDYEEVEMEKNYSIFKAKPADSFEVFKMLRFLFNIQHK